MMPLAQNNNLQDTQTIRLYLKVKWLVLSIIFVVNAFENLTTITSLLKGLVVYGGLFVAAIGAITVMMSLKKNFWVAPLTHISLTLDVLLISVVLYFHGGVQNSWLFMPIFVIFLASYIFGFRAGLFYAAYSFAVVLAMSILQYSGVLPHIPLFTLPEAHWRNPQYIFDYMAGMFVLYLSSAFSIGFIMQLAEQRARRINEYVERLKTLDVDEAEVKERVRHARVELLVKNAELDRLRRVSAEGQLRLIGLKQELDDLRRSA